MAQASEELLIKIDIIDDNTANRINEISEELNHLKVTQKQYEEDVKNGKKLTTEQAKEYASAKAQIADLNKELKAHVKALQQEQQEQSRNKDSLNAMRKQLKELIKEYDNMSASERESVEVGYKKREEINKLTTQIKELEEGTQRYQRNVGNYTNAIQQALGSSVPAIGKVSNALVGLKTSTGWIGLAIEAVVAIVMGLSKAFKRTEGNSDGLKGSMGKLKGLFLALQQAIEPLTKSIVGGFTKAIDGAISALGWLGNQIQKFLRWIGADDLANKMQAFGERAREMATASEDLAVAEEELTRKQREARKVMLEYQRQAEELRQTRDDATKSTEEQEEANRKLLALLQEQKKVEGGIQQEAIDIVKQRIALYGETTENLDALAEAETEYADVMERITGQSSEAIKWQNDRLAKYREEAIILDELIKKTLDVNAYQQNKAKRPTFDTDEDDEEIEDVSAIMTERNNMRLQYEKLGFKERMKLRQENLAIEHAQRVANGEDAIATEMWFLGEEKKLKLEELAFWVGIEKEKADSALNTASSIVSSLKEIGEATGASAEFQKAVAMAEIGINTATAISNGIAQAMVTPFPANIGAIISTISAVISGIAQAKSALSQANVPKYATGGLVEGAGTGTSDSIPAMLSNGESVMTARATSAYSGILSALNTSVGGAPIGESTRTKGTQQLVQQFADAVANQPIYTAVTDINEGQARVAKIIDNSNY